MMNKKENILLDAEVVTVIRQAAFRAKLANGHTFTAYPPRGRRDIIEKLQPGDVIQVKFSPYDMSKGCICLEKRVMK